MKKMSKALLALIWIILCIPSALAESPTGEWVIPDDKTGEQKAIATISSSGNTLNGVITNTFPKEGDITICNNCPGKFKDKPIKGLPFMWGLKDKGNGEWEGGNILDPKTGKIYKAAMTLKGNTLHVRGYLGISLLGRTQIWHRYMLHD